MAQQDAIAPRSDISHFLLGRHRYDVGTPRGALPTGRLNDDISDLFGPGLGNWEGETLHAPRVRFVQPDHILERAAEIEAADKAARKEAAAEARQVKSAALKAAKALEPKAPRAPRKPRAAKPAVEGDVVKVRKPRKAKVIAADQAPAIGTVAPVTVAEPILAPAPAAKPAVVAKQNPAVASARPRRIVAGSSIPKYVTGLARITETVAAKTGPAIVIEIVGTDMTAREIIVWQGDVQAIVRRTIDRKAPVTVLVAQPANDRFRPRAAWAKAA